jgi:hypothetical protein
MNFFWYGVLFGAGIVVAVITFGALAVGIIKIITEVDR